MGGSQQGAQKGARPTSAALELGGGLGKSEQDIKRRKEEKLHYGHGSNNTLQQAKSQKRADSQQHE